MPLLDEQTLVCCVKVDVDAKLDCVCKSENCHLTGGQNNTCTSSVEFNCQNMLIYMKTPQIHIVVMCIVIFVSFVNANILTLVDHRV